MGNGPYDPRYGPPPSQQMQHYQQPPQPQVVYVQAPQVIAVKAPFNHTPHILIDFLSCGAWFPIHMIMWACH